MEEPRNRSAAEVVHDDHHGAERLHSRCSRPHAGASLERDFEPWLHGDAGLELMKPASNDLLQKWAVSKQVNSSRAPDDDATLIERIKFAEAHAANPAPS
jgi:hypothetical protein